MYQIFTLSVIGWLAVLLSKSDGFILGPGFRQVTQHRFCLCGKIATTHTNHDSFPQRQRYSNLPKHSFSEKRFVSTVNELPKGGPNAQNVAESVTFQVNDQNCTKLHVLQLLIY